MKNITLSLLIILLLAGCFHTTIQTEAFDWNPLSPPRSNLLGRAVINSDDVGSILIKPKSITIQTVDVADKIIDNTYKKINASLDFEYKKITLKPFYEITNTNKLTSKNLKIKEISNFEQIAPTDRYFFYQCLVAESYDFVVENKSGGSVDLDVSEIAKAYNIDKAAISINTIEDEPNKKEIHISNPDVCFAFKKAIFQENTFVKKYSKLWKTKSKKISTFDLSEGEYSHWASPRFLGKDPENEPSFRLQSIKKDNIIQLRICKQNRSGISGHENEYTCLPTLPDDGNGNWNHEYYIETFAATSRNYRKISLEINAKRENNTIHIKSARLVSPEYDLLIE